MYDVNTKQVKTLTGLAAGERVLRWDASGRAVYAARLGENPASVVRLDVVAGAREPALQIAQAHPEGIITNIVLTADGRSAVYDLHRRTSDLYIVAGLR